MLFLTITNPKLVTFVDTHGITLGGAEAYSNSSDNTFGNSVQRRYTIFDDHVNDDTNGNDYYDQASTITNHSPLTPLGITVKWVS